MNIYKYEASGHIGYVVAASASEAVKRLEAMGRVVSSLVFKGVALEES